MATRFEFVLHGSNPAALRAAAEEALDEVDRQEGQLSLFRPGSDLARINAGGHHAPVRVAPEVFRLIERALALSHETGGAFDITAGTWMRALGFQPSDEPDPAHETPTLSSGSGNGIELDPSAFTVRLTRAGVRLDLGAIGKGYALDRAADLLRDAGVSSALLHGGTSTIVAVGTPPSGDSWKVALPTGEAIPLRDESLSVSATWGRTVRSGPSTLGHVIDPRSGTPVEGNRMAALVCTSATDSDALSTALLVLGSAGRDAVLRAAKSTRCWFA